MSKKTWHQIKAQADQDFAEVYIFDEIGGLGVSAADFLNQLNALDVSTIHLHINSPGGSVFDGVAIHNLLKQHKARVVAHIDGLAASIASIIALAADEVTMAHNALFMIHNPWTMTWGDSEELRKDADMLDKIRDTLLATYTMKTGKTDEEIKQMMDAETWLDATEAKEFGFVDTIYTGLEAAAKLDLSRYDVEKIQAKVDTVRKDKMDTKEISAKVEAANARLDELSACIENINTAISEIKQTVIDMQAIDAPEPIDLTPVIDRINALEAKPSASAEMLKIVASQGTTPIEEDDRQREQQIESLSEQLAQIKDATERAIFIRKNQKELWAEAKAASKNK